MPGYGHRLSLVWRDWLHEVDPVTATIPACAVPLSCPGAPTLQRRSVARGVAARWPDPCEALARPCLNGCESPRGLRPDGRRFCGQAGCLPHVARLRGDSVEASSDRLTQRPRGSATGRDVQVMLASAASCACATTATGRSTASSAWEKASGLLRPVQAPPVGRARSRWNGKQRAADVTILVEPALDATQAHENADGR